MRKPDGTWAKGHNGKTTHGLKKTPAYSVYRNMRTRCENVNCVFYPEYGGRGITIDPRWSTFEGFYASMGPRPHGMTIERIDNDKGYSPENCVWATRKDQSRNRRGRVWIEAFGKKMILSEWAEATGLNASTIAHRLKKGWPAERAVSQKLGPTSWRNNHGGKA